MDRIENHLNNNPWLRGIYDEARRIAASDTSAVLGDGLNSDDLHNRTNLMSYGDYKFGYPRAFLINHDAAAVPDAYFAFLFLIGGFSCRSVQLYHLGSEYLSGQSVTASHIGKVEGPCVRESVTTKESGKIVSCYPIQFTLGRSDHGEYVFDRRSNSYSLVGFGHVSNFNNCEEMLNHALYRARENIKDNWKAPPDAPKTSKPAAAKSKAEPAKKEAPKKAAAKGAQ